MTKCKHHIFIVLLLAFFPLSASAQVENLNDIGKYFSKKEKTSILRALEYQKAFYNKIFPDVNADYSKIQISVITDVKELGDVLLQKKIVGYYSPSEHKLVICKNEKFKNTYLKTAFHELSHALLHLYSDFWFRNTSPLINEGLAEYLEGMNYDSKKIVHKKNNYMIARVKTLIELRDLDLSEVINWDYEKFKKESFTQEGYGYAVGYCITFFLMTQNDETSAFSIFRSLIVENMSAEDVFNKYYKGGFSQFEKDFISYFSK